MTAVRDVAHVYLTVVGSTPAPRQQLEVHDLAAVRTIGAALEQAAQDLFQRAGDAAAWDLANLAAPAELAAGDFLAALARQIGQAYRDPAGDYTPPRGLECARAAATAHLVGP